MKHMKLHEKWRLSLMLLAVPKKPEPCPQKTFASLRLCVKRIRTMKHMKLHEKWRLSLMLLAVPKNLSRAPKKPLRLCASALNESEP
ncbi:MAG: hypothetical protein ACOX7Q_09115 [Kiritimatiellia bacterium]